RVRGTRGIAWRVRERPGVRQCRGAVRGPAPRELSRLPAAAAAGRRQARSRVDRPRRDPPEGERLRGVAPHDRALDGGGVGGPPRHPQRAGGREPDLSGRRGRQERGAAVRALRCRNGQRGGVHRRRRPLPGRRVAGLDHPDRSAAGPRRRRPGDPGDPDDRRGAAVVGGRPDRWTVGLFLPLLLLASGALAQVAPNNATLYLHPTDVSDARALWVNPAGLGHFPEASVHLDLTVGDPGAKGQLRQLTLGLNSRGLSLGYQRDLFSSGRRGHTYKLGYAAGRGGLAAGFATALYRGGTSGTGWDVGSPRPARTPRHGPLGTPRRFRIRLLTRRCRHGRSGRDDSPRCQRNRRPQPVRRVDATLHQRAAVEALVLADQFSEPTRDLV